MEKATPVDRVLELAGATGMGMTKYGMVGAAVRKRSGAIDDNGDESCGVGATERPGIDGDFRCDVALVQKAICSSRSNGMPTIASGPQCWKVIESILLGADLLAAGHCGSVVPAAGDGFPSRAKLSQ
jgi:hypothetical protein